MMRVLLFVLCTVAEAVGAAELQGRLFFTPVQRAQLEAARAQKDRQQPPAEGEIAAPPAPEIVTYGGIVRRNDGKSTVWLNDRPISDRKAASEAGIAGIRADGAITLKQAQSERSVALKVGQRLDVVSGVIEEPYARRFTRSAPDAKPSASSAAPAPARVPSERTRKRSDEN
jgi:hypothetical protein